MSPRLSLTPHTGQSTDGYLQWPVLQSDFLKLPIGPLTDLTTTLPYEDGSARRQCHRGGIIVINSTTSTFAGYLMDVTQSYDISFYVSGGFLLLSAVMCYPVDRISRWEKSRTKLASPKV